MKPVAALSTKSWESAVDAPTPLPFRPSNDLLESPHELRQRFEEEGYLYIKNVISKELIESVGAAALAALHALGWTDSEREPIPKRGAFCYPGNDQYWSGIEALLRIRSLYQITRDPHFRAIFEGLFQTDYFTHPRCIPRISFPENGEQRYETPTHQDYPYGQGTLDTLTAWVPLVDCSAEAGSLEIMERSHTGGLRPVHGDVRYRCATTAVSNDSEDWRGNDLEAGDILIFTCMTVHRARPNLSQRLRLSVDFRMQPVAEGICSTSLESAFHPKVPGWQDLLGADWERILDLPEGLRIEPAVDPERVTAPSHGTALPWIRS